MDSEHVVENVVSNDAASNGDAELVVVEKAHGEEHVGQRREASSNGLVISAKAKQGECFLVKDAEVAAGGATVYAASATSDKGACSGDGKLRVDIACDGNPDAGRRGTPASGDEHNSGVHAVNGCHIVNEEAEIAAGGGAPKTTDANLPQDRGNAIEHVEDYSADHMTGRAMEALDTSFRSQSVLGAEECEKYFRQVETSLISAADAADRIQNGGRADIAVSYIMYLANLLKNAVGNVGVPIGSAFQIASVTLAKENLMATVASGLRVSADILENKTVIQGLKSALQASASSLDNEQVSAVVQSTFESAGAALESKVVRTQIERASVLAEQLMNDPAMQERGRGLSKQLENLVNDEDVQDAFDSALTLAQSTMENERLRRISSATVSYAGALVESRFVQSTGSGVARIITSAPVKRISSITASTVGTVAANERVRNVLGAAVDTTGTILTSQGFARAASFGLSTTITVAGSVVRCVNSVKRIAFREKSVDELEKDLNVLEQETHAKLAQLQLDQIELAREEEEARVAARAALVRLRANQNSQQELRVQLNRRRRYLLKRKSQEEGVEYVEDACDICSSEAESSLG